MREQRPAAQGAVKPGAPQDLPAGALDQHHLSFHCSDGNGPFADRSAAPYGAPHRGVPSGARIGAQGFGGGDVTSMLGSSGGGELMAMIPQVMQLANLGGGHRHRRHRRR